MKSWHGVAVDERGDDMGTRAGARARQRGRQVTATILALAAVAGCSGGSEDSGSSSASAVDSAPASTGASTGTSSVSVTDPAPATGPATDQGTEPVQPRWATGDADVLFDQDQLHTFEITLSDEALATLDADPTAEEYVEGSLTFDGETIDPIGVRYKGSVGAFLGCTDGPDPFDPSGAKSCTKLSIKLKMNWADPDTEFYGVRRIQLHADNLDPSLMHERLGYWLFREMGVPAPRSTHARVVVNGEFVGVFSLTEQVDGRFTRDRFDDGTGNLYQDAWPFDGDGEPTGEEQLLDALETNEDEDPSTEIMRAFATEVAAAAPGEVLDVIERWTDVETLLRTFVVDRAIGNDDGPLHWYCFGPCGPHNFFWYEDPSARELALIPWDLDNAFDAFVPGSVTASVTAIADPWGAITADCQPFAFGAFGLLQRSAACDPLIGALTTLSDDYARLRDELLTGPMSAERVAEQVAEWSTQIESSVAEAASLHPDAVSVENWHAAIDALLAGLEISRSRGA